MCVVLRTAAWGGVSSVPPRREAYDAGAPSPGYAHGHAHRLAARGHGPRVRLRGGVARLCGLPLPEPVSQPLGRDAVPSHGRARERPDAGLRRPRRRRSGGRGRTRARPRERSVEGGVRGEPGVARGAVSPHRVSEPRVLRSRRSRLRRGASDRAGARRSAARLLRARPGADARGVQSRRGVRPTRATVRRPRRA